MWSAVSTSVCGLMRSQIVFIKYLDYPDWLERCVSTVPLTFTLAVMQTFFFIPGSRFNPGVGGHCKRVETHLLICVSCFQWAILFFFLKRLAFIRPLSTALMTIQQNVLSIGSLISFHSWNKYVKWLYCGQLDQSTFFISVFLCRANIPLWCFYPSGHCPLEQLLSILASNQEAKATREEKKRKDRRHIFLGPGNRVTSNPHQR